MDQRFENPIGSAPSIVSGAHPSKRKHIPPRCSRALALAIMHSTGWPGPLSQLGSAALWTLGYINRAEMRYSHWLRDHHIRVCTEYYRAISSLQWLLLPTNTVAYTVYPPTRFRNSITSFQLCQCSFSHTKPKPTARPSPIISVVKSLMTWRAVKAGKSSDAHIRNYIEYDGWSR